MPFIRWFFSYVDWFVFTLLLIMIAGIFIPLPAAVVTFVGTVSHYAIAVLFFVYGARLKTAEVMGGLKNYRLQLVILASTFVLYPLLGFLNYLVSGWFLGPSFALGMYYTCLLPSTVQSSIGFTSIAGGNVAGAVTAATISNLVGTFATPLLVLLLLGKAGTVSLTTLRDIAVLILLPFVLGQLSGRWTRNWLNAHPVITKTVDKGTIYLVVVSAVSGAKLHGLWDTVGALDFVLIGADAFVIVGIMLILTWFGWGTLCALNRADRIAAMMCGSKKSLATGLPMAMIIFPTSLFGAIAVPIMLLHLEQLIMCSVIASQLGRGAGSRKADF